MRVLFCLKNEDGRKSKTTSIVLNALNSGKKNIHSGKIND